jgi:hypothetical protein
MTEKNIILSDIIYYFHIGIILFVLLAPFCNIPMVILLHIVFCICLLMHWYDNSDVCSLTILEGKLRGTPVTETIIYQFISPIYNISVLKLNKVIWICTTLLLLISLYKLYISNKIKELYKYYLNINSKITVQDINTMINFLL